MFLSASPPKILQPEEIQAIVDFALRILDEVGMRIENRRMCEHLAEHGLQWDGEFGLRFPRALIEGYIEREKQPWRREAAAETELRFSGSVGGYPLRWVDPQDCTVKQQTARSSADLVRLADFLPNIDGIGSIGVPSDVPPLLQPFWTRFINWRFADKTLSNSYVVWETRLCPFILEFCQTVSDMEPERGGMGRYFRAHNYLVSPLRYAREEAAQFVWFWERGHRCDFGNLISMGGTAPATIAGSVGLALAEALASCWIHHTFYGDKGFHVAGRIAPLDMRSGYMPYGRPEEALTALVLDQIAEHLGSSDWTRLGTATGAKDTDFEAGLNKGFTAGLEVALLGRLSWSFGKYSTDEVIDPRMMVVENEFIDAIRRVARKIEVNDRTLDLDVVKEVGPGGTFLTHPHTFEHFRNEMWLPDLFSGHSLEGWRAAGSTPILEKARRKVLDVFDSHHPRGIKEETEQALLSLIEKYAGELEIDGYKHPPLPD